MRIIIIFVAVRDISLTCTEHFLLNYLCIKNGPVYFRAAFKTTNNWEKGKHLQI